MQLLFSLVFEFRRCEICKKAPWPLPLLEHHNGKVRRIFFLYILFIFPIVVLNGRWIPSRGEFDWFWAGLSWKIRENVAPGSSWMLWISCIFRTFGRCPRFPTEWKDIKNRQNHASRKKRDGYVVKKAWKKVASIHDATAEILGVKFAWNRKFEPLKLIKTYINWEGLAAKNV